MRRIYHENRNLQIIHIKVPTKPDIINIIKN